MTIVDGRVPTAPGSREPSPDGLGPPGFDPSRIRQAAYQTELLVLEALNDAYHRGEIEYLHFSPAFDVTAARLAALSFQIARDSDGSPQGGDGVAGSVHDSAGPKDIAQASSGDAQ